MLSSCLPAGRHTASHGDSRLPHLATGPAGRLEALRPSTFPWPQSFKPKAPSLYIIQVCSCDERRHVVTEDIHVLSRARRRLRHANAATRRFNNLYASLWLPVTSSDLSVLSDSASGPVVDGTVPPALRRRAESGESATARSALIRYVPQFRVYVP